MRFASVAPMTETVGQYLYLDVIPALTADEVGGFSRAATRRRGVAVAVTLSSSGEFRMFRQSSCRKLVEHLRQARCVVGYNCLNFDYELIRGQVPFRHPKTIDIMLVLAEGTGMKISLKNAVRGTRGGVTVPDCYKHFPITNPAEWNTVEIPLRKNLDVMRRLHEHLLNNGNLKFTDEGVVRSISVPKGKLSA